MLLFFVVFLPSSVIFGVSWVPGKTQDGCRKKQQSHHFSVSTSGKKRRVKQNIPSVSLSVPWFY